MSDFIDELNLPEFRALAESRMLDLGVFERETGETTTDENDSEVPVWAPLYETKCRIAGDLEAREAEAGGRTSVSDDLRLHTPIPTEATPEVNPGDRFRVTSIGPMTDPNLLGEIFVVINAPTRSQKTARRWPVRRFAS